MSRTPHPWDTFREAYRDLVAALVELVGPDPAISPTWAQSLYDSPFTLPAELGDVRFAEIGRRLAELGRDTTIGPEDRLHLAKTVVRGVQVGPAGVAPVLRESLAGPEGQAEVPADADAGDDFVPRGIDIENASPADGGALDREGWTHAMPPTGDDGGLLGMDAGPQHQNAAPPPPTAPPPAPAELPEQRFLNAEIAHLRADAPLELNEAYVLGVWVDVVKARNAAAMLPDAKLLFTDDEQFITLTIQVTGSDFRVDQDALPLKVPRRGPSRGRARFDVTPTREGRCILTISVHKDGNFLLQLEVTYSVGSQRAAPTSVTVHGRALSSVSQLQKRDLSLTIWPAPGGYDCLVSGRTHTKVVLPLAEAEVADAIKSARDAMMSVVSQRDGGELVFQRGLKIDDASRDRALRTLAQAGADLFQRIFFGPAAGPDVHAIGTLLRHHATTPATRYTFQMVATRFPVPWGLLYMGDASNAATIDPDLFLGMRHVVEQIPMQAGMTVDDTIIHSASPALSVSVNVNADIDGGKLKLDGVARQLAFWRARQAAAGARLVYRERKKADDLLAALRARSDDQLIYLYCHAVTNAPADPGGIRGSGLLFTGDERVTLADLNREAPMTASLPGNPLVFINACESAELRPEFYDGFIPYFMAKGARGVVGTECKTPAVFATEWALEFFPRFLDGQPLGEAFLDLRREFLTDHGNPLGLLYNVYCDGDTRIHPGLTN